MVSLNLDEVGGCPAYVPPYASDCSAQSNQRSSDSGRPNAGRCVRPPRPADFKAANYPFFAALIFAQRARCAAAILFLPAADILRVGLAVLFCADLFPVVRVPSNNRST